MSVLLDTLTKSSSTYILLIVRSIIIYINDINDYTNNTTVIKEGLEDVNAGKLYVIYVYHNVFNARAP